MSQCNNFAYYV